MRKKSKKQTRPHQVDAVSSRDVSITDSIVCAEQNKDLSPQVV